MPSAPASAARASRRSQSLIFGRSRITVTSRFPTVEAGLAHHRAPPAREQIEAVEHPSSAGRVSGKWRPMSPSAGGAEDRVGGGVAGDVARPNDRARRLSNGIVDAAENQRPSFDEPMQVVAGADAPSRRARRRAPAAPRAASRSSAVVIFTFPASPSTTCTW